VRAHGGEKTWGSRIPPARNKRRMKIKKSLFFIYSMCMCVVVCAVKLDTKKKVSCRLSLNVGKHLLLLLFCMNMAHQDHRLLPVLLSYVCVYTQIDVVGLLNKLPHLSLYCDTTPNTHQNKRSTFHRRVFFFFSFTHKQLVKSFSHIRADRYLK
jgi:hypothetical protein